MTHIEAMKQALEALESNGHDWHIKERKAKEALRQAIAEEEKQEPVKCIASEGCTEYCRKFEQPKRAWVGLTDEERVHIWMETETDNRMVLIDEIEAKLKEKNT